MWRSLIASAGARARSMRQTGGPRLAPLPCLELWLWLVSVHDVACVGMAWAWHGRADLAKPHQRPAVVLMQCRGAAWQGMTGHGAAWQGM